MKPVMRSAGFELQLSTPSFILLVAATILIAAGGYTINDYFDRKIDRINKPGKVLVGTSIFPRHAMAWHLIFTIAGILTGTLVAIRIGQVHLSLVFFIVSGLLWFYSTTYKRELILGNIIVALLTALVPFIILLFELPLLADEYGTNARSISKLLLLWVGGFSFFAFIINLIREIVKDAQDFEGDQAYGKNTIPVAWGTGTARIIAIILIAIMIVLLYFSWYAWVRDTVTIIYFTLAVAGPLVAVALLLLKSGNKGNYLIANRILKIVMVTGLGYAITANLIINHMIR